MSTTPPGWGDQPGSGPVPPPNAPPPGYQVPPGFTGPGQGWAGNGPFAREHPKGTTVLVLGILSLASLAVCQAGLIMGPIAWAMGSSALREIDAAPGSYTNRGSVAAGRICGIVATVFMILGFIAGALMALAFAYGDWTF